MKKANSAVYAATVLVTRVIFASFLISNLPNSNEFNDLMGISVHALSVEDAQLVADSGSKWIRIDASKELENASINVKAQNLSVLAILDSWIFNKSTNFTLEDWQSNVTYYVSKYADYVDAWEIWNESSNPNYPLLNLNITAQG